ncbi:MAG: hypothetical protein GF313_11835 [Caldithrix sp.]|nr:hypothetical protein [Caldithrix sp.]
MMDMKKKILNTLFIITGAALLQFILIAYKHYVGYVIIHSSGQFFRTLFIGTSLSAIIIALVVYLDDKIIRLLSKKISWQKSFFIRLPVEILTALTIGAVFGVLFTLVSELLFGYKEPLGEVFISNILIAAIVNLTVVGILEAMEFFRESQQSQLKAEKLERENLKLRFEMLKKQLDPHFLFNSLNILSSLIAKDKKKSQRFIDAFAAVYRYTLDVIDKPVVSVAEELNFAHDYLFLQKLRFENAFTFEINIDNACRERFLPPLTLQTLLENALKHNVANVERPLHIRIFSDNDPETIMVSNNLQNKVKMKYSSGIGLENLKNRYKLISDSLPDFIETGQEYIVQLPLIRAE